VVDKLGSHTGQAVGSGVEAKGSRLLLLPPYSSDLKPIEQVFARLKTLRHRAEERQVGALWRRVGQLPEPFAPDECANYLCNAGYASTQMDNAPGGGRRRGSCRRR